MQALNVHKELLATACYSLHVSMTNNLVRSNLYNWILFSIHVTHVIMSFYVTLESHADTHTSQLLCMLHAVASKQ